MADKLESPVNGQWHDGKRSHARPARLRVLAGVAMLEVDGDQVLQVPLNQVMLSPALGRTARFIRFAGHEGRLESEDDTALAQLDELVGQSSYRLLAQVENHTLLAISAALVFLMLAAAYIFWGIPTASQVLARQLPPGLLDEASQDTLAVLERDYLAPSTLPTERQQAIRARLKGAGAEAAGIQLHFAHSEVLGANALALPDGTIILTDALVELAESDAQVLAVLGHELGHIAHQHAVRQMLQGAGIALTIAMIGGDVSALGDTILALPVVFTQLHYSRGFELEADAHGRAFLGRQGEDPAALDAMLARLHQQSDCHGDDDKDCKLPRWLSYLSTHPHLEERLAASASDSH